MPDPCHFKRCALSMGMVGSEKNKYLKTNMSKDVQKARWPMFAEATRRLSYYDSIS